MGNRVKPTFKIVEGKYEDIDYDSFKKDYMDLTVSKDDICMKYGLSHARYLKYGNQVHQDTGFKRKRGMNSVKEMTNIRAYGPKSFRIDKTIDGKKLYCGTYDSLDTAKKCRDYLVEHNWSDTAIEKCMRGNI